MRRYGLFLMIGVAAAYAGEPFRERLEQGYRQLRSGNIEGARNTFQGLLTDEPKSEALHYGLGRAQYEEGLRDIERKAAEDAVARLSEARTSFEELISASDPFVRRNALFSAANSAALIAKQTAMTGDHEKNVAAFEDAIRAYEEVLRTQPDHRQARKNLDHMRYTLKKMLQNPPPESDQNKEGEQNEEGDQQQEDQSGEKQSQENQPQEPSEQPEPDDSQAEEEQPGDPTQMSDAAREEQPQELNRQNIEAILQSLEEQDRQAQKDLRKATGPPRAVGGKWW